jgi:ribose 1,5-bisphosphokinase
MSASTGAPSEGCLFLIVGNSGSGKDSLIRRARDLWPDAVAPFRVPRRYITRPPHPSEPHRAVSREAFQRLLREGRFCLSWRSHGLDYGVPAEVARWIDEGARVLVNVSRQVIPAARERFSRVRVVFVSVPLAVSAERIRRRGRETGEGEAESRLARAAENAHPDGVDLVIDNSGSLDRAARELRDFLLAAGTGG